MNITQEELAEAAGLHVTFISRVENGRVNLTFDSMHRIASALKYKIAWLMDKAGQ